MTEILKRRPGTGSGLAEAIAKQHELRARADAAECVLASDTPRDEPEVKAAKRELRAITDEYLGLFYELTADWPTELRDAIRAPCEEETP
jgi:hypothetical protein